jgi:hypothetical protein
MSQLSREVNPFMLMLYPEAVLAAVEKSERLGALNRQMCRPLDRIVPGADSDTDTDKGGEPSKPTADNFDA